MTKYGEWTLDKSNLTLFYGDENLRRYEIDLERCKTSSAVLNWLIQVATKPWATPQIISDLVLAFDEILNLQKNYCSWGKECGPITNEKLNHLVNKAMSFEERKEDDKRFFIKTEDGLTRFDLKKALEESKEE